VHGETKRTYVDGAVVRNNPVRVAYEEDRKIWTSSPCRPDIILSVGTGVLVDKNGTPVVARNPHIERLKKLVPARLRKKVVTGLDMVQSTMDCHREWNDFIQSHNFDPRLRTNCHRLDIGLSDAPPDLDAVDRMPSLLFESETYLGQQPHSHGSQTIYPRRQYKNAHEHIRAVARRLVASLFYFSRVLPNAMSAGKVRGNIRCRLTPQSEWALSLLASGPLFRLREVGPNSVENINTVDFMNSQQPFEPTSLSAAVEFNVSGGEYVRLIEIQLPRRGEEWEAIGGF
jgi:hypothetical protein